MSLPITRRTVLSGAPAAATAAAIGTGAFAQFLPESEMRRIYDDWVDAMRSLNSLPMSLPNEERFKLSYRLADRREPQETGKDLFCTAANTQSLIGKAHAHSSAHFLLRQQHVVFPQNQPFASISMDHAPVCDDASNPKADDLGYNQRSFSFT